MKLIVLSIAIGTGIGAVIIGVLLLIDAVDGARR